MQRFALTVENATPAETKKEDDDTRGEQEQAHVVEILDPVHLAIDIIAMQLMERRREVEHCPQDQGDTIKSKEEPVSAPPADCSLVLESVGDDWSEARAPE